MTEHTTNKAKKDKALVKYQGNPLAPIANTDEYIRFVNSVPMLTEEEEKEFARRLREDGDLDAAQKLILSHLRFVVSVARSFLGYGLSLADLIQEGNIGLMKAVRRFDPSLGVRLVSFAVHWIKAEMHDFIIKNWRIVKVATTKPQRKLFFNLRSSHKRLGWMTSAEIQHVAQELNVKESDVIEMEKRMNSVDMQFDTPVDEDSEETLSHAPIQYLAAPPQTTPEASLELKEKEQKILHLQTVLSDLDPRSQDIITERWLMEPKATLHDLAKKYDISPERVRQIESAAMKKLQQLLKK